MVVLTACAFACAFGSLLWLHSLGASGRRPSLRRTVFVVLVVCTVAHVALELGGLPLGGWPAIAHVAACVIALGVVVAMTHGQHVASTPVRDDVVVLAVGAHPDDLELACGGTLRGFADSGVPVHAVVMSSGGDGGDAATRREEARAGAGILGVTQLWHLDYPDRRLAVHGDEMIADLEAVIAQVRPTLVLTHSAHDQHQDHAAVHEAVLRAARRQPSVLCFESPSVTRGFQPTLYVDVSGQLDAKEAAIAAHADQRGKPYMTSMRARTTAAFRGSQTKIEFAEAFEVERYLLPTSTALLLAQGVPVAHVATGEQSAEASIAPAADAQSTIVAPVAIAARPTPHGALEVRE